MSLYTGVSVIIMLVCEISAMCHSWPRSMARSILLVILLKFNFITVKLSRKCLDAGKEFLPIGIIWSQNSGNINWTLFLPGQLVKVFRAEHPFWIFLAILWWPDNYHIPRSFFPRRVWPSIPLHAPRTNGFSRGASDPQMRSRRVPFSHPNLD